MRGGGADSPAGDPSTESGMPTRRRLVIASVLVLVTAGVLYAVFAFPPKRVHVGVMVLNRSGMELHEVRLEFHGTSLTAPEFRDRVRLTEEYGYITDTTAAVPSRVILSFVTPDGAKRTYELRPRHAAGRGHFLDGQEMRIEVQPLFGAQVVFAGRAGG